MHRRRLNGTGLKSAAQNAYVHYQAGNCRQVHVAKHFRSWHAMSAASATATRHPGASTQHRAHLCSHCLTSPQTTLPQ